MTAKTAGDSLLTVAGLCRAVASATHAATQQNGVDAPYPHLRNQQVARDGGTDAVMARPIERLLADVL